MAGLGRCAAAAYKTEQKPTAIYGGARNGEPEGNGRGTGSAQGGSMIWRKSLRRCVGRSNNNANANGGLVYANTNNGSSNSNTNNGVRLAIRPKGVVIDTLISTSNNRLYGIPPRVGGYLRAKRPSHGNSDGEPSGSRNIKGWQPNEG